MLLREITALGLVVPLCMAFIALPKTDLSLLGPIYLPIDNFTAGPFQDAKQSVKSAIEQALATGNSSFGLFDNATTSFAASVFDLSTGETLFDYYSQGPKLNGSLSKGTLTGDTIFRTGSLGKLFTVYAWLVDIGDSVWLEPISKYIPELEAAQYQSPLLTTNWSEVTIGSLASQISGIGRDFHAGDFATSPFQQPPASYWNTEGGFPKLENGTFAECDDYGIDLPHCTRQQKLDGIINHPPNFESYYTPTYSNIAFDLLSFAYENITGRTMADGQDAIFQKLNMTSTSYYAPGDDADTVIPFNESYAVFNYSIGLDAPSGNQYTSLNDLHKLGQAIYTNQLLSPIVTRRWMKPVSFTSQWRSYVGAPWEIWREPVPINSAINTSKIVDTYTKSGNIGRYGTLFAMIPDYGLGFAVLAAGRASEGPLTLIRSAIVDNYYPAYELAAKQQAALTFPGTYTHAASNSSLTLAVDAGTGVNITAWTSRGVDYLHTYYNRGYAEFRLYPTTLKHYNDTEGVWYYKFHVLAALGEGGEPDTSDAWAMGNERWYAVDQNIEGNLAGDAVVVGVDGQGRVASVEVQGLRVRMEREG